MSAPDTASPFDHETFGTIGLPIAMMFRAIGGLRPLLADDGIAATLVDAAFIQAHVLALADILASADVDDKNDGNSIAEIAAKLTRTIAVARLLS